MKEAHVEHHRIGPALGRTGPIPRPVVRLGTHRLLEDRLAELREGDAAAAAALAEEFIGAMRHAPIAPLPEKANEQHHELPAEFFGAVPGPHRKYSNCFFPRPGATLEEAEAAALHAPCERAGLADGQRILELGCRWGSLTLWIAERFPASRITASSNSHSQRESIESEAARRGLSNVEVVTCDMNPFDTASRFDHIVSLEVFEHLRNWPRAFANVARWLAPQGRFFMRGFMHRGAPYPFVERDASDWMSRHFFSGGLMPSDDLALRFQDVLRLVGRSRRDGTQYQRTAEAWLRNMDDKRAALISLFATIHGADAGVRWMRWRLFFISVAELFGHNGGQQWWISHYLFDKRT